MKDLAEVDSFIIHSYKKILFDHFYIYERAIAAVQNGIATLIDPLLLELRPENSPSYCKRKSAPP